MAKVLRDDEMPDDMGVGIEFGIPQSSKRIDFILTGRAADNSPNLIIVELKQWSESKLSDKDGIIVARRGGAFEREGAHPSYQAWSYATLLEGFNEAMHEGGITLRPCASHSPPEMASLFSSRCALRPPRAYGRPCSAPPSISFDISTQRSASAPAASCSALEFWTANMLFSMSSALQPRECAIYGNCGN